MACRRLAVMVDLTAMGSCDCYLRVTCDAELTNQTFNIFLRKKLPTLEKVVSLVRATMGKCRIWSLWSTFGSPYLLVYLLYRPSGCLLPPQNMTVEFLDFRGHVHWLPGPDNPSNTHYTFQLKALREKEWRHQRNCSRTVAMECTLDIPLTLEDVLASYQVRGTAGEMVAEPAWGYLAKTVEPYEKTLLSAPSMKIWVETRGVHVSLTHPQTVHARLSYNITLQQSVGGLNTTVAKYPKSGSDRIIPNLPSGRLYCLIASANHKQRCHMTTERCVYLPGAFPELYTGRFVAASMGVAVLLALIGLIKVMCSYLKARDHTPTAMDVCVHTMENLLTPEAASYQSVRLEEEPGKADHSYLPVAGAGRPPDSSPGDGRATSPSYSQAWDSDSYSPPDARTLAGEPTEVNTDAERASGAGATDRSGRSDGGEEDGGWESEGGGDSDGEAAARDAELFYSVLGLEDGELVSSALPVAEQGEESRSWSSEEFGCSSEVGHRSLSGYEPHMVVSLTFDL